MRSRCLCIRVAAPSLPQIEEQLGRVAAAEKLTLPPALAARLAAGCDRNLRRALLSLEACRVQQYPFAEDQQVAAPDWELYIQASGRNVGRAFGRPAEGHAAWRPPALQQQAGSAHQPRVAAGLQGWLYLLWCQQLPSCVPACLQEIAGDVLREQTPKQLFVVSGAGAEALAVFLWLSLQLALASRHVPHCLPPCPPFHELHVLLCCHRLPLCRCAASCMSCWSTAYRQR